MRYCGKNIVVPEEPRVTLLYGACALNVGYKRVKTHTQNMKYKVTQKKRKLLKNPTKIKEMQEKKFIERN